MNEWIEHDGKGPPDLPPGTCVDFRTRDGYEDVADRPPHPSDKFEELSGEGQGIYSRCWWTHTGDDNDIVAYRVVPQ